MLRHLGFGLKLLIFCSADNCAPIIANCLDLTVKESNRERGREREREINREIGKEKLNAHVLQDASTTLTIDPFPAPFSFVSTGHTPTKNVTHTHKHTHINRELRQRYRTNCLVDGCNLSGTKGRKTSAFPLRP